MNERVITLAEPSEWQDALPASASVFGSLEYACIQHRFLGITPSLYVVESDQSRVVYPRYMRAVNTLPFAKAIKAPLWDTLTPEYTGPLWIGEQDAAVAQFFGNRYPVFCQEQHIVAEFAHLHPWHCDTQVLDPSGLSLNREIVYVDLEQSPQKMWSDSFTYACRKNIKRSIKENVRVFPAASENDVREFYRIYTLTMDRNHALGHYYYPLDYFLAFLETMSDYARFVLVEYKDQVVAATLYLYDDTDVYSYLGGADESFQQVRPTNAVVYDTIQWAQSAGKKRLILGGGYQPNDGIFRFKSSFSPLHVLFHVYKRIHMRNEYTELCGIWSKHYQTPVNENGYFPVYRAEPAIVTDEQIGSSIFADTTVHE
jgi:hypothetical protein